MNTLYLTFDIEPFWVTVPEKYSRNVWEEKNCVHSLNWAYNFVYYCEKHNLPATLFIVGKWAELNPDFVRYVANNKLFKIGSHSYWHEDLSSKSNKDFMEDIIKSKRVLEALTNQDIIRFRAPSFSIRDNQFKLLKDCGFTIDSSVTSSSRIHGGGQKISASELGLREVSFEGFPFLSKNLTILGGGYLRIMPLRALRALNSYTLGNMVYLHPCDLAPSIPSYEHLSFSENLRKRLRVGNMFDKLDFLRKQNKFQNF